MSHLPPPGWHPDPYGRFQLRYWDGVLWTEHVSTHGAQAIDPPAGHVAPAQVVRPTPALPAAKPNKKVLRQLDLVSGAGAPAGTDFSDAPLFRSSVLVVNQKARLGSNVGYSIYDQSGATLGNVREVGRGMGRKALDSSVGLRDRNRRYQLEIVDPHGRMLLALARPAVHMARASMQVRRADGVPVGTIYRQSVSELRDLAKVAKSGVALAAGVVTGITGARAGGLAGSLAKTVGLGAAGAAAHNIGTETRSGAGLFQHRFLLEAQGVDVGMILVEDWSAWDFAIVDQTGAEVARITKTWAGWAKERFTKADNYVVQIHRPLEDPLRSLVVAASLAVDTALKQDDNWSSRRAR